MDLKTCTRAAAVAAESLESARRHASTLSIVVACAFAAFFFGRGASIISERGTPSHIESFVNVSVSGGLVPTPLANRDIVEGLTPAFAAAFRRLRSLFILAVSSTRQFGSVFILNSLRKGRCFRNSSAGRKLTKGVCTSFVKCALLGTEW